MATIRWVVCSQTVFLADRVYLVVDTDLVIWIIEVLAASDQGRIVSVDGPGVFLADRVFLVMGTDLVIWLLRASRFLTSTGSSTVTVLLMMAYGEPKPLK